MTEIEKSQTVSETNTESTIEERAFIAYYKLGESRSYPKLKAILDKIEEFFVAMDAKDREKYPR